MSTKSTLIAVGIIILMLIASFFTGRITCYRAGEDDTIANLTQDSTSVDTLTIVKYDTVYINIHHYIRADVDTVNESLVFSTQIDTSVVVDSVEVFHLKQSVSFSQGYFDIITDLQIRPVEKLIEVTKTSFRTVVKEVTVSEFPDTWLTGFISGVISFLIMVLLL